MQKFLIQFITMVGKKAIRAIGALKSILISLIGKQKFDIIVKHISHIPLCKPLFYLAYYLLSEGMIVQPKENFIWLVRLFGGSKWFTPHLNDAIGHINVIWREGIYDRYKPRKGHVVIDAGAHIGIYTVKASKKVGRKGIILAIEPHPVNFECLKKNLKLNNCTNVIAVNAALASTYGETTLSVDDHSVGHSTTLKRSNRSLSVHTITLDQLIEDVKLTNIDLIKANVEGAMLDFLKGAEKTLALSRPKIVAEVGHYSTEKEEVIRFLADYDFIISTEGDILYAETKRNSF